MNSNKCFCELYKDCEQTPERKVSVGHDQEKDEVVYLSGSEFVSRADMFCPGTKLFLGNTALDASNVLISEETVTLPRSAIKLQCEYFIATNPGM